MSKPEKSLSVNVAAGVLQDTRGQVLISQRLPGTHQAGAWEFPGGKIKVGETPLTALTRELAEELGIVVRTAAPLTRFTHRYADRSVVLDVWRVTEYDGMPRGLEGQPIRWAVPESLLEQGLLLADRPIVDALLRSG
ncbi:MAG: 8-oxo-dGTP diphosphatase MutT [Gammaproteobacteria bacterium]|jgi:8-oxo-dGTP diphosphatase|nr:8-oxo-dGTP diphosphatase MutT [Gammaproteobacteria bacterium]